MRANLKCAFGNVHDVAILQIDIPFPLRLLEDGIHVHIDQAMLAFAVDRHVFALGEIGQALRQER